VNFFVFAPGCHGLGEGDVGSKHKPRHLIKAFSVKRRTKKLCQRNSRMSEDRVARLKELRERSHYRKLRIEELRAKIQSCVESGDTSSCALEQSTLCLVPSTLILADFPRLWKSKFWQKTRVLLRAWRSI
jgi:hypothetical protein